RPPEDHPGRRPRCPVPVRAIPMAVAAVLVAGRGCSGLHREPEPPVLARAHLVTPSDGQWHVSQLSYDSPPPPLPPPRANPAIPFSDPNMDDLRAQLSHHPCREVTLSGFGWRKTVYVKDDGTRCF